MSAKTMITAAILIFTSTADARKELAIIPLPVECQIRTGTFELTPDTVVVIDPAFKSAGLDRILANYIAPATGFNLVTAPSGSQRIELVKSGPDARIGKQGYRLSVAPRCVLIKASTTAGAFYGIQTLRQLFPAQIFASDRQNDINWTIPCVEIVDYPRYKWRGMHMDVSRHFADPTYIEKFIDLLALHKMNIFHWHLTDDDGWRIEIKKYPELTSKGSCSSRTIDYGKPMYYTQAEIRDIVRYAAKREITIVPEIDIPSHNLAAIKVHPEWGTLNNRGELGRVLNIRDKTVEAFKDILAETADLFPGQYFHCGGDEVWRLAWSTDPESMEKAQSLGLKDSHEIQTWLMNEMAEFLATKQRRMVGWGEIVDDNLSKDAIVMAWRDNGHAAIRAAKRGYDVVMAPQAYTYFDHRQAPHEKGFGKHVLPLSRVYSFDPSLPGKLSSKESEQILGAQGQLWSEMIPNGIRMDYMAYPRACALAEVLWSPQPERDYHDFMKRLSVHLHRLDAMEVNYRIPSEVAIQNQDGKYLLSASCGGSIHYTSDGTEPGPESPVYARPIPEKDISVLSACIVRNNGKAGPVSRMAGVCSTELSPSNCLIKGGMRIETLKPGHENIGGWGDPQGNLSWRMRIEEPGYYNISGHFSNTAPARMKLQVEKQKILFNIPKMDGWDKPKRIEIGTVKLTRAGIHTVVLSVARQKGYKGINMWGIDFEPGRSSSENARTRLHQK